MSSMKLVVSSFHSFTLTDRVLEQLCSKKRLCLKLPDEPRWQYLFFVPGQVHCTDTIHEKDRSQQFLQSFMYLLANHSSSNRKIGMVKSKGVRGREKGKRSLKIPFQCPRFGPRKNRQMNPHIETSRVARLEYIMFKENHS